jgi:hypothetical protein
MLAAVQTRPAPSAGMDFRLSVCNAKSLPPINSRSSTNAISPARLRPCSPNTRFPSIHRMLDRVRHHCHRGMVFWELNKISVINKAIADKVQKIAAYARDNLDTVTVGA